MAELAFPDHFPSCNINRSDELWCNCGAVRGELGWSAVAIKMERSRLAREQSEERMYEALMVILNDPAIVMDRKAREQATDAVKQWYEAVYGGTIIVIEGRAFDPESASAERQAAQMSTDA